MASAPRHLRIFLASPGDVADEREIALQVLDDLPYDPLLRGKVTIEDVAWDKQGAGAPILAGVTPQDSIAAGLPKPSDCDIVVVVFWSRMGTPLPASYQKEDGNRYESGTEWEYGLPWPLSIRRRHLTQCSVRRPAMEGSAYWPFRSLRTSKLADENSSLRYGTQAICHIAAQ